MPFTKQEDREKFNPDLLRLRLRMLEVEAEKVRDGIAKGDFTFIAYYLAKAYISAKGASYTNISNAISCLNDAAEQLRSDVLQPYEQTKKKENGDIE